MKENIMIFNKLIKPKSIIQEDETHILLFAPTGGGKGVGIVHDTPDEVHSECTKIRESLGNIPFKLDPSA